MVAEDVLHRQIARILSGNVVDGHAGGITAEQVIRPTGLIDPPIEVRKTEDQIDDLISEINMTVEKGQRAFVTTLTKKMAESLTDYFVKAGIRAKYLHSEVDTLERLEIIRDLRLGEFDVLVGINLLREGLDIPEVSLVAILDADKEGFLRTETSLIQTIGRAARNIDGHEPILTVRGPVIQAQFVETMILLVINHQSLVATKSNRIVRAAQGRPVMEFGSRRAHGTAAAIFGARAAYIAGCCGTACTISDRDYNIPALGTMAHSWVQMFPDEYEAFKRYAEIYPQNCVLLVDTYNVLKTGVPAAIKVFKEVKPQKMGIRIDSGDMAYLTKRARKMLDDAGLQDCSITVSNALDEYIIRDVIFEGAQIDAFGVGERLITAMALFHILQYSRALFLVRL